MSDRLIIEETTVRWYDRDVHDGDLPRYAIDNARTETKDVRTVLNAVHYLRAKGLTEYSSYPVPSDPSPNGWWSNPDGPEQVWGGDQYDQGHDREEITARVSGRGAYAVHAHMKYGTEPARRMGDPIIGRHVADDWDGESPWQSALGALIGICNVLWAIGNTHDPRRWWCEPGMTAHDLDEYADPDDVDQVDHLTHMLALDYRDGAITEAQLVRAGDILDRYADLIPEHDRY